MSEAIDSIKNEIRRRAEKESKDILKIANQEAQTILQTSKDKADRILTETVKGEVATMKRKIIGSAQLEGRKMLINAREEVLSNIFKDTKERLINVANRKDKKYKYEEILLGLIKEAATKIDEEKLIISANKRDSSYISSNLNSIKRKLNKELGHNLDLVILKEPQDLIGGVIVFNSNRTKIFNNTLEGRLLSLQSSMRGQISKILIE